MTNENLCSIFIFLEIEKWQMKIYVQFLFFSEHRKMKKENKICGQFSFFFSGLITEMKLTRK